jgi:hypothetical protein
MAIAYPSVSSPHAASDLHQRHGHDEDARDSVEQQVRERRPCIGHVPEKSEVHERVDITGFRAEENEAEHKANRQQAK